MKRRKEYLYLEDLISFIDSRISTLSEITQGNVLSEPGQIAQHNTMVGCIAGLLETRGFVVQLASETTNEKEEV